ncbi:cell-cycle control medial ring component [Xylariales sp. PMI_506]|nr:cell-cycle control medial ring component [Xylariales sp. PMI_506]
MTEVNFAKTFLAALDARPVKLSSDHVEDPRTYPARNAYTLRKLQRPMSKPQARGPSAPGSERSLTVTIKSLRNPPLDVKLTSQPLSTSVLDLKTAVVEQTGIPADKIKLLFKKKPVLDSKVLKDLVADDSETSLEFSVMILGGAATLAAAAASASSTSSSLAAEKSSAQAEVAQGTSGKDVLATEEFWGDLKGFLLQRIRDEATAGELFDTFQSAWKAKG